MKTVKLFLSLLFLVQVAFGQTISNAVLEESYWSFTPRFGYDFPTYDNNTPFIDYDGGISAGISIDKYWKWFGVGADFDYIKNAPNNTFPTTDVFSTSGLLDLKLSSTDITRMFYGIGPSFKYQSSNNKFIAELNARAGLSTIDGGRLLLEDPSFGPVNFHAGYDQTSIFATKAQLRFNYFFTPNFGAHIGGYYINHYNVPEENESGVSALYYDYDQINQGNTITSLLNQNARVESCNCNISSIGVFAGLSFKIPAKVQSEPENVCAVCGKDHTPHCCATCGCDISITARDKYSKQVLANTDVVLKDAAGNIVETGTTNNYGVVVFKEVKENNYTVEGKLYDMELEETTITLDDFADCKQNGNNIQKEIIYADINFILKGNVVECNKDEAINGVDIQLRDQQNFMQSNTLSDDNGEFIFHVKQASTYLLKGNKNGYFSNEVSLATSEYDRNKTLIIDFEMCVNPCGEAIKLDNINFDLDKWNILPESRPDLDYVVKLMQENPEIKVEMSSHTDSRGSHAYNQTLSQKRAQSTVDYLVAKGINKDRLLARGAGETELLNRCADGASCSEEEHRINRRTEFKVICID